MQVQRKKNFALTEENKTQADEIKFEAAPFERIRIDLRKSRKME